MPAAQESDPGESELEGLQAVLDSCFLPALGHAGQGRAAPEALDTLVVDLLSVAQSTSREREKVFAVEALEALQRQCPMSMAVTLRHYSQVLQAVREGAARLLHFRDQRAESSCAKERAESQAWPLGKHLQALPKPAVHSLSMWHVKGVSICMS